MHVGHVPAIFPAENPARGHRPLGWFVETEAVQYATYQMDQQVAGDTGAVLLPATPARVDERIEGTLRDGALPRIPVERLRRKVGGGRVLPGARRIVAAERTFHQAHVPNRALGDQFLCLG